MIYESGQLWMLLLRIRRIEHEDESLKEQSNYRKRRNKSSSDGMLQISG